MTAQVPRPRTSLLPVAALAAAAAWLAMLFLAPSLAAPATVTGLDGEENHVDYAGTWLAMDPVPGAVYGLGDLMCHQKAARSWTVNGNQLPVAGRMTAIFAASVAGLGLASRPGLRRDRWFLSDGVLEAGGLPDRLWPSTREGRVALAMGAIVLGLLPASLDVLVQGYTGYESTMTRRAVTGALAGLVGGVALGAGLRVVETVAWRAADEAGWITTGGD